eukprot:739099_1
MCIKWICLYGYACMDDPSCNGQLFDDPCDYAESTDPCDYAGTPCPNPDQECAIPCGDATGLCHINERINYNVKMTEIYCIYISFLFVLFLLRFYFKSIHYN